MNDANNSQPADAPVPLKARRRRHRQDVYRQDLGEEIAMLRDVLFNVADLTMEERSAEEMIKLLDKISQACTRLGTLLKTDRELKPSGDLAQAFHEAVTIVNDPQKLQEYYRQKDRR